jgi:hypothetical protein
MAEYVFPYNIWGINDFYCPPPRILQVEGPHAGAGIAERTTWWLRVATCSAFVERLDITPATAPETARTRAKVRTAFFIISNPFD